MSIRQQPLKKHFITTNCTLKFEKIINLKNLNKKQVCLLSLAAVYIVPGSFGWGVAVFAAITILQPSFASFSAIALPIPRLAPVINAVFCANFLQWKIERQVKKQA